MIGRELGNHEAGHPAERGMAGGIVEAGVETSRAGNADIALIVHEGARALVQLLGCFGSKAGVDRRAPEDGSERRRILGRQCDAGGAGERREQIAGPIAVVGLGQLPAVTSFERARLAEDFPVEGVAGIALFRGDGNGGDGVGARLRGEEASGALASRGGAGHRRYGDGLGRGGDGAGAGDEHCKSDRHGGVSSGLCLRLHRGPFPAG